MFKTWRRGCLLTSVAAGLIFTAGVEAQETDATGPSLVIEERIMDFGQVAQGSVVESDFVLKNQGDAPLLISAVRPTCGCTVVDFDREIEPGGSGKIHTKLDTTGFRVFTLHVKDLSSGEMLPLTAERVTSVVWAEDEETLFFTVETPDLEYHVQPLTLNRAWRTC